MSNENLNDTQMIEKVEENEKVEEVKKPQLPFYLVCESKMELENKQYNIFDLSLEEVIYEKMYILFEKYQVLQKEIDTARWELQLKKEEMLRETDFKKELGISTKPTIADKEAVMRPFLSKYEDKVDEIRYKIDYYNDKLKILNDLISSKRVLLEIEASLK